MTPPAEGREGGGGTPGNKSSTVAGALINTEKRPDWKTLFLLMRGTVQLGILVHKEL